MVAKVEWHPEELVPRIGFIVTNLSRSAESYARKLVTGISGGVFG